MLTPYINKVIGKSDLSTQEMEKVLTIITSGEAMHSQIGFLLAALRMKGVAPDELVGAARMVRRHACFIDTGARETIDTCGTGGDGADTFNISTTSAFVAAGAGAAVAKHGNRSVSSRCGSADVLAACGFRLDAPPEVMEYAIQKYGIGFLFAQKMHPVLGRVAVLRRELKQRTIFNMLGPLCNPAGAPFQLMGVFSPVLTELFAHALKELGCRRAMVVHGDDGLDEISISGGTRVSELRDGLIRTYELYPEMLLGTTCPPEEIRGGDAAENARIMRRVLDGSEQGAPRLITLLNAGAAIYVAGRAATIQEGIRAAGESIDSGAAMEKLNLLIEVSKHGC